ncbi:MAG TPA: GGDEF domain-containing protein, partial [Dehalococcoidia bacterium]|nr:GGDEF domain-containing protein [Dehalococcoidia bacterium]
QIYNRRYFYDSLAAMLQSARNSKGVFSVILLDLDGLKAINDNYGHLVGDSIITGFAALLSQTVRDSDIVARLGGDEFGIIMPHSDKQGAFALSKRLWEELERRPVYQKDDLVINVSVSIGVSGYPWGGETVEAILQWADRDMYANKVAHKFRPQLAATQPATSAAADLDLIPDL